MAPSPCPPPSLKGEPFRVLYPGASTNLCKASIQPRYKDLGPDPGVAATNKGQRSSTETSQEGSNWKWLSVGMMGMTL